MEVHLKKVQVIVKLSRGNYNLHFYVEDLSGKKSNVYIKQYNIQSISKPIIIVWKLLLILAL